MSLDFRVFQALEKQPIQAEGGFVIPYTVLLSKGTILAAYRCIEDDDQPGCRKEYDLSPNVVLAGLGVEDEYTEFVRRKRAQDINRVAAMFVEKIPSDNPNVTSLQAEYLTPQNTHNLLSRGSADARPRALVDTAAELEKVLAERKQRRHEVAPPQRSGLLQQFPKNEEGVDQNTVIRFHWSTPNPSSTIFNDNSTWSVKCKRNVYSLKDFKKAPFERSTTFDGSRLLCTDVELDDTVVRRVERASGYILSKFAEIWNNCVGEAVLFFKIGPGGVLYFLYAPLVQLLHDLVVEKPPIFRLPVAYRSTLRKPRPSSMTTNEEDLVVEPKLNFGPLEPVRARRKSPKPINEKWALSSALESTDAPPEATTIDLDKMVEAIETSFPAPLPEHVREGTRRPMSKQQVRAPQRGEKRSPCPFSCRENLNPNLEALEKRREMAVVNNARALLSVLEGRRPLDSNLIQAFKLTKAQRKFLSGSFNAARMTNDQVLEFSRPSSVQSSVKTRPPTNYGKKKRRETSPPPFVLGGRPSAMFDPQISRAGSEHLPVGKPRPLSRQSKPTLTKAFLKKKLMETSRRRKSTHDESTNQASHGEEEKNMQVEEDSDISGREGLDDGTSSHQPLSVGSRSFDFPELADFVPRFLGDEEEEGKNILLHDPNSASVASSAKVLLHSNSRFHQEIAKADSDARELHKKQKGDLTVEQRIAGLLARPLPAFVEEDPTLNQRANEMKLSVVRCVEYLYALAYHISSFFLARKEEHRLNSNEVVLLFSLPPKEVGVFEKRLVSMLKSIPSFEQMNTEENISELQYLLMSTKSANPQIRAVSFADSLFSAHTLEGANIISIPTFAVTTHPSKFELQSRFTTWILGVLRTLYVERIDELNEEALLTRKESHVYPSADDEVVLP